MHMEPRKPTHILDHINRWVSFPLSYDLRVFWIVHKEEKFYSKNGEPLYQVSQRSCECAIIGRVQSHVRQGFEQPNLTDTIPARGRGID